MNKRKCLSSRVKISALKSSAVLAIVTGLSLGFFPETKLAFVIKPANSAFLNNAQDEDFNKKFREGRDLIDKEEWAKAAEKFNEISTKYPGNKSADAALYWLAFCYKKQNQFKSSDDALSRLIQRFPSSSWANDAKVMKLEIAAQIGRVYGSSVPVMTAATTLNEIYSTTSPGDVPYARIEGFGAPINTTQAPLDREAEIKIAAFQSLLSADPKRGIEAMRGILRSSSKASEGLKLEVLRAVRRPRIGDNNYLQLGATTAINSFDRQMIPALGDALVNSFQNETNVKVRKEVIYTLANLRDEQSVKFLAHLYTSETDREVKKAIINGLGPSLGVGGFYYTGIIPAQSPSVNAAANTKKQTPEFAKLLEIVRTEKDGELQQLALSNLQRTAGWETNAQAVTVLSELYNSEASEGFKKTVIQNLGKIKLSQASRKLMDIARNDKSNKLKLEAIYALRNSNTPEALKYLEELIK